MNETPEQKQKRIQMAHELCRINPDTMDEHELNLAVALITKKDFELQENGIYRILVPTSATEKTFFHPMSNAAQLLEVFGAVELAVFSHEQDDKSFRYSAHAYLGDTRSDGSSVNEVVGIAVAKLLKSMLRWSEDWT